ncbi:MAG TPA: M56 family metallopeptidase [Bryobacteraceae bacterium]|nr:M56 family metallopeptidase [Bryobacteraceae bacterium]
MSMADAFLVLLRATLLFVSGLAVLSVSKRWTPAARHLICLSVIGGSLAAILAVFLPDSAAIIHIPSIHIPAIAGFPAPEQTGPKTWSSAAFAGAIWVCGCALVLLRFLIGCTVLWRLRRSTAPFGPVAGSAENAASGVQIRAADVSVPVVTGLIRPVILLPRTAVDWPEWQARAAIRHELAHVRRWDLWANLASIVACSIYWFHPLIWILARHLRAEQEAACDDLVVQSGFDRADYAEALVETARRSRGLLMLACPMTDCEGVKARVVRVLSSATTPPAPAGIKRMSAALFASFLFVFAAVSSIGQERVYKVGGAVTAPAVVWKMDPAYTPAASQAKVQGQTLLDLVVGPDGTARDVVVVRGIDAGLDNNAVQAVRQWRFKPATRNSRPVAVTAKIEVNFRLR